MSYKLVIVESPNKVETIKKYLGENYNVMASVGHIARLSKKGSMGLGIDMSKWEPEFEIDPAKKEIVKQLKTAVKDADFVYIATDPDREGEAIGDHLVKYLKCKEGKFARIKYNEITKDAILYSVENPTQLDQNLIDAQKTRRMLDRIIGFRLSQLMQKKLSNSPATPSAGRVQSIALKLVVDREKEIENFVPRGYYSIEALISNSLTAEIYMPKHIAAEKNWVFPEELESVKKSIDILPSNILIVKDIKDSKKTLPALTPFKQAALYKKSPFSSSITQASLQRLYEGFGDGGLISYPRTDSTRLSHTFVNATKNYISIKYGDEYVLDKVKGFKGDQDAHEAIRPTDITLLPDEAKNKYDLNNYDYQIYKLIYEHTLMCLITPPLRANKTYKFAKDKLEFRLNVSWVLFDGYYIVKGEMNESVDPDYKIGQLVNVKEFVIEGKETKPPARYSEGSLIEKLDDIKVGRPSTFATTVKIILNREYVRSENSALVPTDFGKLILEKLIQGFPDIINEGYTAEVENQLDLIATNKISVAPVMEDFYSKFKNNYESASQNLDHTSMSLQKIDESCPNDNGNLVIRRNKRGNKFIACDNFPKCNFTKSYDDGSNKKRFFRRKTK
ncbi:type I DNA topoisomerase [Mycoplasmopsis agalactiae]|nr:type I DNA topoisomerase [Mycoplasmopsis agalactiae]MCE6056286.1 type I DNA topoisomerase [Mycoplasmopsis agalactiae]MCE6056290.1 type I DNA topoisomerase [Mycoplasmopsis agalactiae]